MKFRKFLLTLALCAMCVGQASALEFTYDAPEDYLFGRPTSQDSPYVQENPNVDRSKNTALIPPGFGTSTSYLPGSGEALTPNLIPGALNGGLVNQVGSVNYPTVDTSTTQASSGSSITMTQIPSSPASITQDSTTQGSTTASSTVGFTDVTDDLYYSGGYLGTLKIPSLNVDVKVYEGTDSSTLAKGAGHNRGTNCYFGNIHKLNQGDTITLTTKLGTRNYSVTSVEKVSETDTSGTAATTDNQITLFTCVRDQSAYRWKVVAVEAAD